MRAGSNWRHLNGLSLGMMGDPVRCLPKVVHPDVAALKLQHNLFELIDRGADTHLYRIWPHEELERRRGLTMAGDGSPALALARYRGSSRG